MNRAEKEPYLREYSLLKAQGKPFFPYAVAKDSAMACVVHARDHPACRSSSAPSSGPRPTRRRRPTCRGPSGTSSSSSSCCASSSRRARAAGDDRRPDDLHDPAVPAAVLRPRSRAAARAAADRDARPASSRSRAMALPDLHGRARRLADADRHADAGARAEGPKAAEYNAGKQVVAQSGCLACHKIGENGNDGPGPAADRHRRPAARGRHRADAHQPDRADAVVRSDLPPEKFNDSSTSCRS